MLGIELESHPRFRVAISYGERGHKHHACKQGLPFPLGCGAYIGFSGAQISLDIGPLGILPYVRWAHHPWRFTAVGAHIRTGKHIHNKAWFKQGTWFKATFKVKTVK